MLKNTFPTSWYLAVAYFTAETVYGFVHCLYPTWKHYEIICGYPNSSEIVALKAFSCNWEKKVEQGQCLFWSIHFSIHIHNIKSRKRIYDTLCYFYVTQWQYEDIKLLNTTNLPSTQYYQQGETLPKYIMNIIYHPILNTSRIFSEF